MKRSIRSIDSADDFIDTRDIEDRLAYLMDLQDTNDLDDDDAQELEQLSDLRDDLQDCSDYHHGMTLIADHAFIDYAQDLATDIGAINSDTQWPATCIDWEQAAQELQMDYSSIEFDGTTYWFRD